ncbi:DNA-binding protein [Streptomyces sp. NPDC057638]|uniref:WD40 repeat domain-containing protein n=1 Tax=Streptomyces sp. NPDC057638 TaxID=3346190 RepID=UPI0036A425B5
MGDVGRREVPVDPGAGPVQRFAHDLRELRRQSGGPTYRVMARGVPYAAVTLSRAAAGEQLPSLEVTLAYVQACGGDLREWERRWREVAEVIAHQAPADDTGECPYQGLARFEAGDHDRFFGRGQLIERAAELTGEQRFAAVFGPSGSGKSSLLRAGLIPALRAEGRGLAAIRILTPGEHPLRAHATALTPKMSERVGSPQGDTLLVVDQFEEAFTLCTDPAERAGFIDRLLTAQDPGSGLRVIIAVRADFYSRCAEHRDLADALSDASLVVGPMNAAELREAVVGPAQGAGLIVEREVTARLITEAEGEPGGLPLLSHALRETWRRRRGRTLTMAAYEAAGGTHGAIARTAEDVFADFTDERQRLARLVLLRLITPGTDGAQDTRRPVPRTELDFGDPGETALVVERLARARLLTLDDDTVDLAHEALITAWPRLNNWIEEGRERLRAHRRLTEAAHTWHDHDRDPSVLYRGTRLTVTEEHFTDVSHDAALTRLECAFLAASRTALTSERRRRHVLLTVLATVIVLALIAGVAAVQQSRETERERLRSEVRALMALAAEKRMTSPTDAVRLSLMAWRLSDDADTRGMLRTVMTHKDHHVYRDSRQDSTAVRFLSADGRTLVTAGEQSVTSHDLRTQQIGRSFPALAPGLIPQAMSSDMRHFLVRKGDRLKAWDIHRGQARDLNTAARASGMSPSGRIVVQYASGGQRAAVRLKDARSGETLLRRSVNSTLLPRAVISGDDRLVALCLPGEPLEVRDISANHRAPGLRTPVMTGSTCADRKISFTPDSRRLVLVEDRGVRMWDIATGSELPKIRHKRLTEVAFSTDSTYMTATDRHEILFWRLGSAPVLIFRYHLPEGTASELRIDVTGRRLHYFASTTGNIVRSLTLEGSLTSNWQRHRAAAAVFSPDGTTLATARIDSRTGRIHTQLADSRNGRHLAHLSGLACPLSSGRIPPKTTCKPLLAFSPDGRALAYGISDAGRPASGQRLFVHSTATGRTTTVPVGTSAPGEPPPRDVIDSIAFGPDGTSLLAHRASTPARIETWDLLRRALPQVIAGGDGDLVMKPGESLLATSSGSLFDMKNNKPVYRNQAPKMQRIYVFSPRGRHLLVHEESSDIALWDGDARRRIASLGFSEPDAGDTRNIALAALTPDRQMVAIADHDGQLKIYGTDEPLYLTPATAGGKTIALAFSRDGTMLYTASEYGPPQAYNMTLRHAIAQAEARNREQGITE